MSDGRPRVLYVEDNDANLALVKKVLEHVGYAVQGASSGEDGLAMLDVNPPDLVLVDLDLPGIDGFEVVRQIKSSEKRRSIPCIAISASVMKEERRLALDSGCVYFVEKPFDIGELRAAVNEALSGRLPSSH